MHRILLILLLCSYHSLAQQSEPILTLNTEMHTAIIRRIDSDAEGKYILTVSNDKTAKLWETTTGKLLRTYRPPRGEGNEGMLYAGALSPDGKLVAVGGFSGRSGQDKNIYIFNAATGELIERIEGLANVIYDLEFSPNGYYLVAALGRSNGIRVYRTNTFSEFARDSDYGGNSLNIAFDSRGRLATVSYDGYIRLYDNNFSLLKKVKTTGGKKPFSLAFSPDATLLAVGYNDSPKLQVLDANSLQLLYEPDITSADKRSDRLNKLTFSKDGQQLIAGGFHDKYENGGRWQQIRIWQDKGKGSYQDYTAADNTILDVKTLPNGNIYYAGGQPDWGILNSITGKRTVYKVIALNDHKSTNRFHFKLNHDGFEVGLMPLGASALSFNLINRQIMTSASTALAYKDNWKGIRISDWEDSYQPKLANKALSFLEQYEMCRSVDIAEDAQRIVFGANWNIYCLDEQGNLKWKTASQSDAFAVNIAGNGKVLAAAPSDGTVRWYRMSDGELLLTLFMHPDNKRWVIWTPSGYYDAAPGAEDLIGWHVNQGADREAKYYPASRFRFTYYRPDMIDRILEELDEDKALAKANAVANRRNTRTRGDITNKLPPSVRILSPSSGSRVAQNQVRLQYRLESPAGEVTGVKILVDGRPISTERGLKPTNRPIDVTVSIPSSSCKVSILAENEHGTSEAATIDLLWEGQMELLFKPTLYVLAIGVSDYAHEDVNDLDYAAKDAQDFVQVIQQQEGLLYQKVSVKLLTEEKATDDNILDGFDWIQEETTQHDVAMIFFAGHGKETNSSTFYFLPHNTNPDRLRSTAIMKDQLRETVATIAGKVVVFLDACHSGNAMKSTSLERGGPDINRIVNELMSAENGAITFTSSTSRQKSLEDVRWQNGAFTEALLEGLSGKAATYPDKVTCKALDVYITKRVKELTDKKQAPTTTYPANVEDFPIAIIKD